MSKASVKSPPSIPSKSVSIVSQGKGGEDDDEFKTNPDFIYGGPFITVEKPSPLLGTSTPINMQLQGTFKKSFAYYSLVERLPIILTKVIDYCSRESGSIRSSCGASDGDLRSFINYVSKLKNDLITNKKYELLQVDTPEAKKWNEWIEGSPNQYYFTNIWVFTECYVYRRLREGCELYKTLATFDPFQEQKSEAFNSTLEPMCVVADKLMTMLPESDKDKRKADFVTLMKICLWANKCDLSLSVGDQVKLQDNEHTTGIMDPFQMITDLKDKLLVDDTGKAADQIITKAENMAKTIEGASVTAVTPVASKAATAEGGEEPEPPKIPCPAKMTIPQAVMFDIVCDNAGYELFADLCLAHFLVSQKIVQKVRFHVKKIPWFVSDVTPKDFQYVIDQCRSARYDKKVPQAPKPDAAEGEAPPEPLVVSADNLHRLGDQWTQYVADGIFIVMSDDFWTSPHVYKDMKKYDYNLYRKLQYAVAIMFKGDLNYRKLLGERNCSSVLGFEAALQGFIPAPILAVRTVKAELICGLPKGKADQISKIDPDWMRKGDYGVIHFCPKAEPLKVADRPCLDYGDKCRGTICPTHNDL
ncbi:unnamed protein product [Diatraea saccharalis]|uniref:Sugar phosphate phosphatase n=1 Tax=Diatraea saccharalis TaxID=40085 RepID=A0A9N9WEU7_9NEOP|nr:unnamed protein product [Diatraea saccharalis]